MSDLHDYHGTSGDWRSQLARNERQTKIVIALFILLYLGIGFLIDLVIVTGSRPISVSDAASALLTLQITPYATIIGGAIAAISIWITFSFHDKLMLLGTEYHEVTSESQSLQEQQLYHVVEEMKVAAGLQFMPKVYIIEENFMNAFASGYSEKSAMVAITRGLLEKLDRAEMQAVMAHELSHIRHSDIKLTLVASILTNIMLIAIDILFSSVIYGSRDRERRDGNNLMVIIMVLRFVLPIITVLLTFYLSRTREYMADAGCVELMRDNQPLARALLKIDSDYKQNAEEFQQEYKAIPHEENRLAAYLYDPTEAGLRPTQSIASFFSTHPPLRDRLRAIGFIEKE